MGDGCDGTFPPWLPVDPPGGRRVKMGRGAIVRPARLLEDAISPMEITPWPSYPSVISM